jgi:hypothetical protein
MLTKTDQARLDLAKYLGNTGRGINCRIDIQILTLEDIRKAAYELNLLTKNLIETIESNENDVVKVLSARHEFVKLKLKLKKNGG